jgi:hypothetical protein
MEARSIRESRQEIAADYAIGFTQCTPPIATTHPRCAPPLTPIQDRPTHTHPPSPPRAVGPSVHAQGCGNRRKAKALQQGPVSRVGFGPFQQHHPIGAISAAFSLVHTISKPTWSGRSALMGPSRSCKIASTSTCPRRGHPIRRRSHHGISSQLRRARSKSTSTWGSSCPTTSPTASAGTVKSLSTISWEGLRRPLRPEGSTAIRTRGACLRVLVSGQRVTLGWA